MLTFKIDRCPKCGRRAELMISNNPISPVGICFDCIIDNLDYQNIEHADFFCRTYNLPFDPNLWIALSQDHAQNVFREYTRAVLDDVENRPNLAYTSSTRDLWARTNKEWAKTRSFVTILNRIPPIKESYIDRSRLKWGEQYTFEELIKLDSVYSRTLRANNITNPIQKQAVQTLCKLQIEMDNAIRAGDPKAIKDYSAAYATFAKQADLETMINETKTDDITTVAELYQYMEDSGFKFRFFDGVDKDEIDRAITDIQQANRTLILESTGIGPLLEQMAEKKRESAEQQYAKQVVEDTTLQDLINFTPEDNEVDVEDDDSALNQEFEEDA